MIELSGNFSPEFFLAVGEPYDRSDLALNAKGEPVSLYSAICMALDSDPDFKARALEHYGLTADQHVSADAMYLEAIETNLGDGFRTPIEVWIDKEGDLTVEVYDER